MSIRAKVILWITVVFVVGAAAVALFMQQTYQANVQQAAQNALVQDARVFAQLEANETAKLSSTAFALETNDEYRAPFVAGDRAALVAKTEPVFAQLKKDFSITHWYFESTGESSTVFLRVHKPAQFGDALKRKTYLEAVKTSAAASGLELGATAVALRVVRPYYAADGTTLVGFMELGQEIEGFLTGIKEQTGDDVGLLLAKGSMDSSGWAAMRESAKLDNNWEAQKDYVLAATTDPDAVDQMKFSGALDAVPDEGEILGEYTVGGRQEVHGVFPVKDAAGARIGLIYVKHDITPVAVALRDSMIKVLGAVLAMLVIVLAVVIILMNSLVFGRLDHMIAGMEAISTRVAGGDFDVHFESSGKSDEIGKFEEFFAGFITLMASTLKQFSEGLKSR